MFRANPQRTGVYHATGVREFQGIKWKFKHNSFFDWNRLLDFYSHFVLGDGIIYLAVKKRLLAIDSQTGQELWTFQLETGSISDLVYHNEVIYINDSENYISAIAVRTREQKWRSQFSPLKNSNLLVVDELICFGNKDGYVYALDSENGELLWRFKTTKDMEMTAPAFDNNIIYVGSKDGHLYAVNAQTGEQKWKCEIGSIEFSFTLPVIADDTIYIETKNSIINAVDIETGQEKWQLQIKVKDKYILPEKNTVLIPFLPPVIANKIAYIGSIYGYICAIDLQSRQKIWQKKPSLQSMELFFNNLIAADGIIYHSCAGDSTIYALEQQTGRELWKFTVPDRDLLSLLQVQPDLFWGFFLVWNVCKKIFTGTPFVPFSPPIVADGAIYINCANGYLYALH